jgi:hypothetical protein
MQCVVERARWNRPTSSVRPDGPGSGLPWACARRSASDPLSQTRPMPVAERRTWTGGDTEPAPPPRADDTPARTRRGRARVNRPGGNRRQVHQGGARAAQLRRSGMFVASQTPRFPAPAGRHGGFTELSCRSSGAKTDTKGVGFYKQVAPPELAPPFREGVLIMDTQRLLGLEGSVLDNWYSSAAWTGLGA